MDPMGIIPSTKVPLLFVIEVPWLSSSFPPDFPGRRGFHLRHGALRRVAAGLQGPVEPDLRAAAACAVAPWACRALA